MNEKVVFGLTATVTPDGKLNFVTHTNHDYSFERIRSAMLEVHKELARVLEDGPKVCPFRHHMGAK